MKDFLQSLVQRMSFLQHFFSVILYFILFQLHGFFFSFKTALKQFNGILCCHLSLTNQYHSVSACDAYLNIIGGLWLDEPAADLAAVVALASSYLDRPVPADLVAIGEVGLTGELRSVSQLGQRVSEVRRLGFTQCLIPSRRTGELAAPAGLRLIPVRNIGEAIRAALRPSE